MIYTWHKEYWHRLLDQVDRTPHALLLSGTKGGGKMAFAQALAARFLCETAAGEAEACSNCPSCNWFLAGNHPDFRLIEPVGDEPEDAEAETESSAQKKKSEQIRIHQIRALDDFLAVGTHRQGYRVIVIRPAEAMNQATANSLLKVLEEPNSNTLFILVTNNKRRLLPTILSRCHVLNFPKPAMSDSLDWLRQAGTPQAEYLLAHAGGMPLAAVDEAGGWERLESFYRDLALIEQDGPVMIAGRWESWFKETRDDGVALDRLTLVVWMQKWVFDLLLMKQCGATQFHAHKLQEVRDAARKPTVAALLDCYNDLLRIRAVSQHPLNLRLFLEDMLSRYARAALSGR